VEKSSFLYEVYFSSHVYGVCSNPILSSCNGEGERERENDGYLDIALDLRVILTCKYSSLGCDF
jgi:hypothetical protein